MNLELSMYDATLIPAIMLLLYIVGTLGIPRKLLPVVALVVSIAASLVFIDFSSQGVLAGILLTATVIGFHSGPKNVIQAFSDTTTGRAIQTEQVSSGKSNDY